MEEGVGCMSEIQIVFRKYQGPLGESILSFFPQNLITIWAELWKINNFILYNDNFFKTKWAPL